MKKAKERKIRKIRKVDFLVRLGFRAFEKFF